METYREAKVRVKEERRTPQQDLPKPGNRLKKKPSKKNRGEFTIRVSKGSDRHTPAQSWIWNNYRDRDTVLGALKSLGKKFSFYFIEALDPDGKVIDDNSKIYEERRAKDKALRIGDDPAS